MKDSQGAASLVGQTTERLRELIIRSERVGEKKLPPELELARQLGVSRSTVREALALVAAEGLIYRVRRRGTIIRSQGRHWGPDSLSYPVHLILSLPEFLRHNHVPFGVTKHLLQIVVASDEIREALPTIESDKVFCIGRLYEIEGKPAAFLEHYIPTVIAGYAIEIAELHDGAVPFLERLLATELDSAESTITAECSTPEIASNFGIDVGAPVLVLYAKLFAAEHGAIALGRLIFRPDVMALTVRAVNIAPGLR